MSALAPSAPKKTGRVYSGRDVRFEEGGRFLGVDEGVCWVCSRSMIPHPTHACRSCRAGKPENWVAPKPVNLPSPPTEPSAMPSTETKNAKPATEKSAPATAAAKVFRHECGATFTRAASFGSHAHYCRLKSQKAKNATPPQLGEGVTPPAAAKERSPVAEREHPEPEARIAALVACDRALAPLGRPERVAVLAYLDARFGRLA